MLLDNAKPNAGLILDFFLQSFGELLIAFVRYDRQGIDIKPA
jgi:hypothetical protein